MKRFQSIAIFFSSLAITGCAIHPLTGDYSGDYTASIVHKIRCEASMAIEDKAIERLRNYEIDSNRHPVPEAVREDARRLAEQLEQHREQFKDFNRSKLKTEEERKFFDRYIETGIALEFTFDISEDNVANTEVDFVRVISGGSVTLPIKAGSDRMRQNVRKFQTVDKFSTLLKDLPDCAHNATDDLYPIQGSVGLRELISTFVDLNEDANLQPVDKAPVFGDQLTFTTTLSGSVVPQLTLTPAGRVFRVSGATLTETASRTDKHMLNVGLSRETEKVVPSTVAAPFNVAQTSQSVFTRRRDTAGKPISGSEQRAADAIVQQRIDTFYDRLGQLPTR